MCALCPGKIVNSVAMCMDLSQHQFISPLLPLEEEHLDHVIGTLTTVGHVLLLPL
jgi:hypothetical protein